MREVVLPCERMEDRSETEVCAEGGRERGRGGYGCGVATVAAVEEARVACLSERGKRCLQRVCV